MSSTLYDVKLRYGLEGNAASGLDAIAMKADRAARAGDSLKASLWAVAGAFGVHSAFETGKEVFITFNSEMERLKISMGAVIQMNLGGTFAEAKDQAADLFKEFQRFSVQSPLTTKEVAEFGQTISAAVFSHGGSMKDFIDITENASIAAKVLGSDTKILGIEMQHLLQGDISSRMIAINNLMNPILKRKGLSHEQFKGLSDSQRMGLVKEALTDPGLMAARKGFEQSFEGVTSTLKDKLQIALGEVGLPLFKKITAEIASWNQWIDKNKDALESFGRDVGDKLVAGFEALKSVVSTLVAHKDELLLLGRLFTVNKLVGMGAGMIGGLASNGAGEGSFWEFQKVGVAKFAGGLLAAAPALVAFHTALEAAAGLLDKWHADEIRKSGELASMRGNEEMLFKKVAAGQGSVKDVMSEGVALQTLQFVKEHGAFTRDAMPDYAKIGAEAAKLGADSTEVARFSIMARAAFDAIDPGRRQQLLGFKQFGPTADDREADKRTATLNRPAPILRIDRIEVASDDPDRFAVNMVDALEKFAKNPTQAATALRGL